MFGLVRLPSATDVFLLQLYIYPWKANHNLEDILFRLVNFSDVIVF